MRKAIPLVLAAVMIVGTVGSAQGPAYADPTTVSITSGTLTGPSSSHLSFTGFGALAAGAYQQTTGTETITINDSRGSGAGWNVTVSATDWVATNVPDPTAPGATLTVTMPVDNTLFVRTMSVTSPGGSDTTGVMYPSTEPVTKSGFRLIMADVGHGMGAYDAELQYQFVLPKNLPPGAAISSDPARSQLNVGNPMGTGVFAGVYTSTITYTTGATP